MESEEFYDSLDGSEYDSLENSLQHQCTTNKENLENDTDTTQDDELIPFYDKEMTKSQVELSRKSSKSSTLVNKGSGGRKKKITRKTAVTGTKKLNSKSYLDLFYAKIGAENTDNLSAQATCVDFTTRSYETCANGDEADVESVYFKTGSTSNSSYTSTNQDLGLSLTSLMSNLRSVSEQNMDNEKETKPKSKSISKIPVKKITELGRLGPEISLDKLELYRKRQQYGKKASQTNLIKMLEKKTLQNLEREIKNSKIYT